MTKLKIAASAVVVAGLGAALVLEHQAQTKLRDEANALRQRVAQMQLEIQNPRRARKLRLPAPPMPAQAPSAEAAIEASPGTNFLVQAYRQAGDDASAQATLQIGLDLGQRLDDPQAFSLVQNMVGTMIQSNLLATMDPNTPYGDTGHTVQNQRAALSQRCQNLKATWLFDGGQLQPVGELVQNLSEPDLISFCDRARLLGGWEAAQWLLNRQSGQ